MNSTICEASCHEIAKFFQKNPSMPYDFQDAINYASDHSTLVEAYVGKSPTAQSTEILQIALSRA
jgi:hypothetical protein